jgi:hypothetical protein
MAQDLITGWAMGGRGRALWMVGDQEYKVQVVRTPLEEALTWTNDALAGASREFTNSEGTTGGNSRVVGR